MVEVYRKDPFNGQINSMQIDFTIEELNCFYELKETSFLGFKKYQHPTLLIQEAFPNLTPEQREFIMTGITPEQWNNHLNFNDEQE